MTKPDARHGELRQQVLLRTQAIYQIEEIEDEHVWVSVVSCPGLKPGAMVKLTKDAIEAMPVVERDPNAVDPLPPLSDKGPDTPR